MSNVGESLITATDEQVQNRIVLFRSLLENPDEDEKVAGVAPSIDSLLTEFEASVREDERRKVQSHLGVPRREPVIAPPPPGVPLPAQPMGIAPRPARPDGVFHGATTERHDRPHR